MKSICLPSPSDGIGGVASFQRKLATGLARRSIPVTHSLDQMDFDAVLVTNSTRHLRALWQCKRRGVRIVQRLGGLNWNHHFLRAGWRTFLLSEWRNLSMRLVRDRLAHHVVYQSRFVESWWTRKHGPAPVRSDVIYNGVNLSLFTPQGARPERTAQACILSVEGIQGATPSDWTVDLAAALRGGGIDARLKTFGMPWKLATPQPSTPAFVSQEGTVPNGELPYHYRGADLFVSTDVIAACPNSVIEALACGVPVLGFEAGVLPEMLDADSGLCVPYGADPWQWHPPKNTAGLVAAARQILADPLRFRRGARRLAEERYDLDQMVDRYLAVLEGRS